MPQKMISTIALVISTQLQGGTFEVAFPSERPTFSVPGFVRIEWREPTVGGSSGHTLRFLNPNGDLLCEYSFNRHVKVFGNKASRWIAITDFSGSSESTVVVFLLGASPRKLDIRKTIEKDADLAPFLKGNHHTYIEALGLSDTGVLTVKVRGYGDQSPKGFSKRKQISLSEL